VIVTAKMNGVDLQALLADVPSGSSSGRAAAPETAIGRCAEI
jgi:hypothetical protein